jgi:hypothetical protein
MGIHFSTYYRWKRQLDRHGLEILAQSPAAMCCCPRSSGRRCAFSPPPRSSTWPRPSMPATRRRCSWAPTAACGSGAGRLRPSRVDPRAGAVIVAVILTEVKGKLIAGPAQDARRPVDRGLPPFVVHELKVILPPRSGPAATASPLPVGGRCGFRAFGRAFGCRRPRRPACRACASTTFATPPWRSGSPPARRPRRSPYARVHLSQLHPGPLRPPDDPRPVAEGRCHPVRD